MKGFVLFCTCLFVIGFVSEFLSFVKLCFGKILVMKPGGDKVEKNRSHYKKVATNSSLLSSLSSSQRQQNNNNNNASYNSFEMTAPNSQSDTMSVNSSKSLVSMCSSSSAASSSSSTNDMTSSTGLKSSANNNNNNNNNTLLASYSTHLDLIKFHPTDLVTNLQLIQSLSRINRSTYTRFDFMMRNILKLVEIIIGYGLMLLIMTFNFWFLFSLVLGYTCGYFVIYGDLFNVNYFLISKMLLLYDTVKNIR